MKQKLNEKLDQDAAKHSESMQREYAKMCAEGIRIGANPFDIIIAFFIGRMSVLQSAFMESVQQSKNGHQAHIDCQDMLLRRLTALEKAVAMMQQRGPRA